MAYSPCFWQVLSLFSVLLGKTVNLLCRPPSAIPAPPVVEQLDPVKPEIPVAVESEEEEDEPQQQTVRAKLKKEVLVNPHQPPDTTLTLKKAKAREILPGVILENKELSIQLEQENESLNIRRSKTAEEQVQMMWKQKF